MAIDAFSLSWLNLQGFASPPPQDDFEMSDKNQEGEIRTSSGGTGLASATVVADHHGTCMPTSPGHSTGEGTTVGPTGQPSSSSGEGVPPVSRMGIVRDRFKASGLSEEVAQLFLG